MMRGITLVVAALLLLGPFGKVAIADDIAEHPSKHATQLLATLDSVGINDRDTRNLIDDMQTHMEKSYFTLAERKMMAGRMALRYGFDNTDPANTGGHNHRQMELHYTPQDSHFEYSASNKGVKANYRINLDW